ncbi:hypothetical protein [Lysinibacillus fusiformis]
MSIPNRCDGVPTLGVFLSEKGTLFLLELLIPNSLDKQAKRKSVFKKRLIKTCSLYILLNHSFIKKFDHFYDISSIKAPFNGETCQAIPQPIFHGLGHPL